MVKMGRSDYTHYVGFSGRESWGAGYRLVEIGVRRNL